MSTIHCDNCDTHFEQALTQRLEPLSQRLKEVEDQLEDVYAQLYDKDIVSFTWMPNRKRMRTEPIDLQKLKKKMKESNVE